MKNRFLDAAARQAAEIQRKAFLHMLGLQMGNVLQPLDPDRGPIAKEEVARVFERINEATDELCTAHADSLPADCTRAPVHLQMVSLALASQEVLLEEAQHEDYVLCNALKARRIQCMRRACAVHAPCMRRACTEGARRRGQRDGRGGATRWERLLRGGRHVAAQPALAPLHWRALLVHKWRLPSVAPASYQPSPT